MKWTSPPIQTMSSPLHSAAWIRCVLLGMGDRNPRLSILYRRLHSPPHVSSSHHLQAAAGFPRTPWHLDLRGFCTKESPAGFKPRNEDLSKFRSLLPSSPKTKPSGPGPTWAFSCSVSTVRPSIVWQIAFSSSSLILSTSFDGRSLWIGPT